MAQFAFAEFQRHLTAFDFQRLFNELGWDRPVQQQPYTVDVGGQRFLLNVVAHKRGVQILHCQPGAEGQIPPYALRQKIDRKITTDVREHLIVFSNAAQTAQVWQWVARVPGRPSQYRELTWRTGESAGLLRQKLASIAFTLDEEETLTVLGVTTRLQIGFDRDKVTKKFYGEFDKQRKDFAKFIAGIPDIGEDLRWYTAVLIDRLMFLWFLQEKGFLDSQKGYLRQRLANHLSANHDTSFYRRFLCPLFFRGFAEERTDANRAAINAEFGNVPYLNGGLFAQHELEQRHGAALDVADAAFQQLFDFFAKWDWHLDDRPLASGKEVNPDVLGYIFEKFVNQKQMGAYYTKEDITEYIGKNTIIPSLLTKVRAEHPGAFDALAWPLLQESGDAYLYPAILKGVDLRYPAEIAAGLDTEAPELLERRKPWNKRATDDAGLPTEIWRETIARHQRTREIRAKIAAGKLRDIGDLITHNLDIRQFAQDLIERCTDVALLKSFWFTLAGRLPRKSHEKFRHGLSVLDPTCGSGAFLFAALNILKPLYDATLRTLHAVRSDALIAGEKASPEKWAEVDDILARFATQQSDRAQDYAVIKHIIVHNLYGVDIEEQATEIAKLRLFLKLVALLEPGDVIEPLPDIDFNIRHGNTLVGYASAEETERAVRGIGLPTSGNLFGDDPWQQIKLRLLAAEQQYNNFQIQQGQHGGHITAEDKQALSDTLQALEETLNEHLARDYGVDPTKPKTYQAWKASHKPFHWFVDFYPLMTTGGFDVVIGNPPYVVFPSKAVEYSWPRDAYECLSAKNLYALVAERCGVLANTDSYLGLIVQLTSMSSERMDVLRHSIIRGAIALALPFPRRPESIFEGVEMPTAIWLWHKSPICALYTSSVRRFYTEERPSALDVSAFVSTMRKSTKERAPKLGSGMAARVLERLTSSLTVATIAAKSAQYRVHYQEACRYWTKSSCYAPRFVRNGESIEQPHGRAICLVDEESAGFVNSLLNSSLFYWYYSVISDCEHINDSVVRSFPLPSNWRQVRWSDISVAIDTALRNTSTSKIINTKQCYVIEYDEINGRRARNAIMMADNALADLFGLTPEEEDYIVNYDIKYRMGQDSGGEDD
ncbi:Eco57I restriction-modification methylase domain-containing protein [Metallibacterium scheffleri]